MTRRTFDQELDRLQDEVLALGSLVEEALIQSVETLKGRDFAGSRRLIAGDRVINERRYAIEEETIALIATQQPMARDTRLLAAILEIVTELERMGDYAKGIARTIAVRPEIILMDEPASALDPIATLKIEDLMRQLAEDYTIIVVTHNIQHAARVSDYTAFFMMDEDRAGYLVEQGPTQELFTKPGDWRTEDYITGRFG